MKNPRKTRKQCILFENEQKYLVLVLFGSKRYVGSIVVAIVAVLCGSARRSTREGFAVVASIGVQRDLTCCCVDRPLPISIYRSKRDSCYPHHGYLVYSYRRRENG